MWFPLDAVQSKKRSVKATDANHCKEILVNRSWCVWHTVNGPHERKQKHKQKRKRGAAGNGFSGVTPAQFSVMDISVKATWNISPVQRIPMKIFNSRYTRHLIKFTAHLPENSLVCKRMSTRIISSARLNARLHNEPHIFPLWLS